MSSCYSAHPMGWSAHGTAEVPEERRNVRGEVQEGRSVWAAGGVVHECVQPEVQSDSAAQGANRHMLSSVPVLIPILTLSLAVSP